MERIERSGDDLIFLYTGGTTGMPKAVMWRHEDLFGALAPLAYSFFGLDMPEDSTEAGALARKVHESGLVPVHLPASPLMHGTGQFSTLQALFLILETVLGDLGSLFRMSGFQHRPNPFISALGENFQTTEQHLLHFLDVRIRQARLLRRSFLQQRDGDDVGRR